MSDDKNLAGALAHFLALLNEFAARRFAAEFPNVAVPIFTAKDEGQKYIRVVSSDGVSRCSWGFIDREGNILKSDGWKRPAKGVRGSIYSDNPLAGCSTSGPAYLRR